MCALSNSSNVCAAPASVTPFADVYKDDPVAGASRPLADEISTLGVPPPAAPRNGMRDECAPIQLAAYLHTHYRRPAVDPIGNFAPTVLRA